MQNIPWQRWAITFIVLILLGLAADFFFLHFLFHQKQQLIEAENKAALAVAENTAAPVEAVPEEKAALMAATGPIEDLSAPVDNFLKTLQACRPDISSQGLTTPEALMAYLEKSVGKTEEIKDIENFHIILPNGDERRLHFIPADRTSGSHLELRYFKIDAEGYPERIPLKDAQTFDPDQVFIDSLLAQGKLKLHQVKSVLKLKDGGTLALETHNDKVYEFQLREADKTLSCRKLSCQCQ